jgi:hypothetical protein
MDQILNEIPIVYTDPVLNEKLKAIIPGRVRYTRHFSRSEDFFLKLPETFTVPSLPIHHDVRLRTPSSEYLAKLRSLYSTIFTLVPDIFSDLSYLFDPAEILRPAFFHVYRFNESLYLFLLRTDLQFRPQEHEVLTPGTNDRTAEYRSDHIFLEADIIPLENVLTENTKLIGFTIKQSISQTWVGESGRGYFVQGIWIDREITKFLSKLFLHPEKRTYPYYPYTCKHRAVCHSVLEPEASERKKYISRLHRIGAFLGPYIPEIEEALKRNDFSENLEAFKAIKEKVPRAWYEDWNTLNLRPYLNDRDMKEYAVEISS